MLGDNWVLTRNDVDDIDRGDSPKNGEDVGDRGEDDGDGTAGGLETGCADDVERGGEVLFPCGHVVQRVAEGDVVEHDVGHHDGEDQNAACYLEPIMLPVTGERVSRQHDLWGVVQRRKVARDAHAEIQGQHQGDRSGDDLHESVLDRVHKLRVDWQHIALIRKREENDARSIEELGREACVSHLQTAAGVLVAVVYLIERVLDQNSEDSQHKARQRDHREVLERPHISSKGEGPEDQSRCENSLE